ncbi:unnamed protein product, partial [Chrysoparadoxa australica]
SCAAVNLAGKYLPNHVGQHLGLFPENLFCGAFSKTGDTFLSACQDARIRLYKTSSLSHWATSNPRSTQEKHYRGGRGRRQLGCSFGEQPKPYKTIACRDVGWSIISTDFSPNEEFLAYSSWSPYVHLCNTAGDYEMHEALDFTPNRRERFCLFSIAFSPSTSKIAGGGSDAKVYVYNLERKEVQCTLDGHTDDVNTVTYLDSSSQTLLSGSDDCLIRVWDTRTESSVGALLGHGAGLTCVTARGDGYHFLTNSKDQSMKLWDIRVGLTEPSAKELRATAASGSRWDYRWEQAIGPLRGLHSRSCSALADRSVMTFTGHRIFQTLVRCYFSPQHSTAQRFAVSGSQDGRVMMWDLVTGEQVFERRGHDNIVRDVAWHSHLPLIASSSWDCTVGLWVPKTNTPENGEGEEAAL